MENLNIIAFEEDSVNEAIEPKKIKTRAGDFKHIHAKMVVASPKVEEKPAPVEEKPVVKQEWAMPKEEVVVKPVVAPTIPEWKEPVAVVDHSAPVKTEAPKYEWQEPVKEEKPAAPASNFEEERSKFYNEVPRIKSKENIGDLAEKYKKLAATVDRSTYFGKVLLNGVAQIKKYEVLEENIEEKIKQAEMAIRALDDKKMVEVADQKAIEDVLERTTRIPLDAIKAASEKESIAKVNNELSKIRGSISVIGEVAKEADSVIEELEGKKAKQSANISAYERQLNSIGKDKKDTCNKLEEDLIKADKVDKTIEAEAEAKEKAEQELHKLRMQKESYLSDISFLTT